jgi:two-component system, NarL family, sensor histidine kinase DesK
MQTQNPSQGFIQKTDFKQQLSILLYSVFFMIGWFYMPQTLLNWAVNITGFALFLVLYFVAFNRARWSLAASYGMVLLSVAIAPFNWQASCIAIYASCFFAYTQTPKVAILGIFTSIAATGIVGYFFKIPVFNYFGITAIMSIGMGFMGIFERQRLITKIKEDANQNEINRLSKIAEQERIGRDVHDLLGHTLTVSHLKAQLALSLLAKNDIESARKEIEFIEQKLQSSIKSVRHAVEGIQQLSLTDELVAQQTYLRNIGLSLTHNVQAINFPQQLESDITLMAREAITNSLRHADANHIDVSLTQNNTGILLKIKDNGKGISDTKLNLGKGLRGIKNRAENLGGSFEMSNDNGLILIISLPWKN